MSIHTVLRTPVIDNLVILVSRDELAELQADTVVPGVLHFLQLPKNIEPLLGQSLRLRSPTRLLDHLLLLRILLLLWLSIRCLSEHLLRRSERCLLLRRLQRRKGRRHHWDLSLAVLLLGWCLSLLLRSLLDRKLTRHLVSWHLLSELLLLLREVRDKLRLLLGQLESSLLVLVQPRFESDELLLLLLDHLFFLDLGLLQFLWLLS
mmetsp:Transcript_7264/g.11403  ORF Transcript_7264/g.11403 Transcript_7264/m.11403 type:complete len:206 (-) Transcript_7264:520-1137(-)